MRTIGVFVAAAAFAVMGSAVAQTPGSNAAPPPAEAPPAMGAASTAPPGRSPEVGSPLLPATDAGLDKVAADGVSTRTVPARPCSTAARESDGTTTCIGIPGPVRNPANGGRE
jgi:hypothetical protein